MKQILPIQLVGELVVKAGLQRGIRVISYLHTDHRATLSLTLLLVMITNSVKWQFL